MVNIVENTNNSFLAILLHFLRMLKLNLRENKQSFSLRLCLDWFTLNSWWTSSPRNINSIAGHFRLAVKTQNFDPGGTEC